jgi:uncharacterized protein (TIGR00251 family)
MSFYNHIADGLVIAVKAQPGAKRTAIGPVLPAAPAPGWPGARLKITVQAPPEDGRANTAIITALAAWLGVKPSAITLTAGATSRDKRFIVVGARGVPDV